MGSSATTKTLMRQNANRESARQHGYPSADCGSQEHIVPVEVRRLANATPLPAYQAQQQLPWATGRPRRGTGTTRPSQDLMVAPTRFGGVSAVPRPREQGPHEEELRRTGPRRCP